MARLSVSLLGPFRVTLAGAPVSRFKSNKVRALLAYLAVERDRPQSRQVLAGLLWPDWPDRDALSNLRYALSDLRKVIGDRAPADGRDEEPPVLLVTRDTLQMNPASDTWIDVAAFARLVDADDTDPELHDRLERAVALYRGSFLEGFSVEDSARFEEWALFMRERMARQLSAALHRLAAAYEERGETEQMQAHARRQLELEPWDEVAHRQVMRALALQGQRSAALAHYETCRRLLAEELQVEPGRETTKLYEQIRDGTLSTVGEGSRSREPLTPAPAAWPTTPSAILPSFLREEGAVEVDRPVFVARKRELAQLDAHLDRALSGEGRVVFVMGDAGSGKTALTEAFTRRAQDSRADLIVASGGCNAYTGVGDPYLPFRQILGLLTGDVEARWAAGAITRDHAGRLWNTVPFAARALVERAPDLIDTFLLRGSLLERARLIGARTDRSVGPDWLIRLEDLLSRRPTRSGVPSPQRTALFEQYTGVLQAVARRAPLVLVLDDLQWADAGSIHLLFHLGRRLPGSRILVVGAYRGEEVAIGRGGERHPLEPVVNELQRDFGSISVDLGRAESRDFLAELLDSEPNRLGSAFREMLYRQTRGHPLFTIELLRGLQECGDLVQDADGQWVASPSLGWELLPARVEAVIGERIGRLDESLRSTLQVASVEGERFTAEVVARVRSRGEQETLRCLSGDLDRRHRLVRAESIQRIDGETVSRYRFRHILFQKYVYGTLDDVERAHLHERVGDALETLYREHEQTAAVALQMALHFEKAGITEKAIRYLQRAGDRAVQLSAYQEATAHLKRAQALLETLPDPHTEDDRLERRETEMSLLLSLGLARMGEFKDPEWQDAIRRARDLCQQLGKSSQLCRVLSDLSIFHYVRAEYQEARELAEEALTLARGVEDPLLMVLCHWQLGFISFARGDYLAARAHLERVISFYDPQEHHRLFRLRRGVDIGLSALAYDACSLWCLGYPEQAARSSERAVSLARELDHPWTTVDVLSYGRCLLNEMRREASALKEDAEEVIRLSEGMGFPGWLAHGSSFRAVALTRLGRVQEGLARFREAMADRTSMRDLCYASGMLGALAEAQAAAGEPAEGLSTLSEALALVERTGERFYEPELYRMKGELLWMEGDEAEAEASFCQAVQVARDQHARSWELRATTSVCRLWHEQGRDEEARQRLAEIYDWFTEGFSTPDLREAKTLLEELS